ncbi:MAG: cupin domain-containing protein [Pseudomonadota bacterium]
MAQNMTAKEIISALALEPHPEGGWFRETWRGGAGPAGRAAGTAIFFLLEAGQRSHWHRVDATEIWHFYAGQPLSLSIFEAARDSADPADAAPRGVTAHVLGPDLAAGQSPQIIVPADAWQSAEAQGGWSLVGCTVSPGFEFAGFTLAAPGWRPGAGA